MDKAHTPALRERTGSIHNAVEQARDRSRQEQSKPYGGGPWQLLRGACGAGQRCFELNFARVGVSGKQVLARDVGETRRRAAEGLLESAV
jgi:hypothetical protein